MILLQFCYQSLNIGCKIFIDIDLFNAVRDLLFWAIFFNKIKIPQPINFKRPNKLRQFDIQTPKNTNIVMLRNSQIQSIYKL